MKNAYSLFLFLLCMLLGSVHAQTVQVPVAGTKYVIVHSGNYVLAGDATNARIMDPTGAEEQKFEFIPVEGKSGVYNIKNSSTGKFLGLDSSNGYATIWREDDDPVFSRFIIETVDDVFVKFLNVGTSRTNNYIGTDAGSAGSGVYTDKSGEDIRHYWKIMLPADDLAKQFLQEDISSAKDSLENAVTGDEVGQYPSVAMAAFTHAVRLAEEELTGTNDQLIAARTALKAALATFLGEKIAFIIQSDVAYYIRHSGGMFLGKGTPGVSLTAPSGADTQQFKFVSVTDERNVYNIQLVATEEYLTKEGSYNLKWATDASVNSAQYKLELAADGDLVFKCLNNNAYVGTDNAAMASGVYSNKSAGAENSHWTLIEVDPNAVMTVYLESLISAAGKLIENSPVGDKGHQWPQSAVDELKAAVSAAEGVLGNPQNQENVNTAAETLNTAVATFNAAKITPMLEPEAGDRYRIANRYRPGNLFGVTDGSATKPVGYVYGDATQHWEMILVEGTKDVFIVKYGEYSLNSSFGLDAYDKETSQRYTLRYKASDKGVDYYAFMVDDTKCLSTGGNTVWNLQTEDGQTHRTFQFVKVDFPNDPDKRDLTAYIPTAQTQLESKTYGTETGTWSIHSRDSLTLIVQKAQAIATGSGNTQEVVNDILNELKGTVTWHEKQKISVLLEELTAAILEAQTVRNAAVVGTKQGEYYQSVIDEFVNGPLAEAKKALVSSVQEDIDAAAEKLKTDTEAFKTKAHASDVGVERVLTEAIESAETLCNSVTPGVNKGDYPAYAKEEFAAAIVTAKESAVTQETLDALLAARAEFEASKLTVDRTALNSAIQSAKKAISEAAVGEYDGQYPQSAKEAYQEALATAEHVYPVLTLSQEAIDDATAVLKEAGTAFNLTKVVIDFTALKNAINQAITTMTLAQPEKGEGPGTYPESAFTTLDEAIEAARLVNTSKLVSQKMVGNAVIAIETAEQVFKESRIPNDYSVLNRKIREVENISSLYAIGTNPGEAPASAFTELQASLNSAKELLTSVSQSAIDVGVIRLNKDLELFYTKIVWADVTALNSMISAAKAAIKKYGIKEGELYETLATRLADSEELAEEPIVQQKVVDYSASSLGEALAAYINATGINNVELEEVTVYAENGELRVTDLPGGSFVRVYTTGGALVYNGIAGETSLNLPLKQGSYIVQLKVGDAVKTIQVLVK